MKSRAFSSFLHLFCLTCCVVDGTILLLTLLILFCSVLTQLGVNITGGSVFRVRARIPQEELRATELTGGGGGWAVVTSDLLSVASNYTTIITTDVF